jgi:hypothetical protein
MIDDASRRVSEVKDRKGASDPIELFKKKKVAFFEKTHPIQELATYQH